MPNFYIYYDEDLETLVTILGTDKEIANDRLLSGYPDTPGLDIVYNLLQDTGSTCEDYAIASNIFKSEDDIPALKRGISALGFKWNDKLATTEWG